MPLIVGQLVAQLGIEDDGYSDGMSAARAEATATSTQITAAENRIRAARSATNAASTRLQAAEAQLAALRASGNASAAQLTAAEARVTAARQAHTQAIARNAQATAALRAEQAAATTSTNALTAAATRARAALSTIGIGVGLTGAVVGIRQAVMAASDLAESTNKVDQLFGSNADQIKKWAAGAAEGLAMTNVEARDAASSMALYGQQAGLAGDNLVNFSTKMTTLAADLASFSNTSPQEAVEALGAAFRGESDPIEQYGVLLNEDRLKQEALKAGLISTTSDALSPAIRVQAVYNSVLSQTTAQQGDFARTADSFSNQLKIIRAEAINAAASFGEDLIPVAQMLANVAAGLIPVIGGVASVIGGAASVFNSLPGPVQAAIAAIVAFRIASHFMGSSVSSAAGGAVRSLRGITTATQEMNRRAGMDLGRFGAVVGHLGNHVPVIARMQTAFTNAAISANRFPRAAGAASAAMVGMRGAASGLMGALGGPWGLAIAGASAALGFWMQKKSEDAAKSQEAKAATQEWADALLASKGAIDDSVRSLAVKKIAETNAYESADKLGISQQTLTDKVLAGREAYDAWFASLSASGKYDRGDLAGLTGDIQKLATEVDNGRDKAVQMARANGDMAVSFDGGQQSAGAMSKAMADFEESTDGAASKVDKLAKALNELRDDKLTQEEALQAWSDGIRDLAAAWTEAGAAAVKADGHIDVTTEKGSALQDAVVDQAKAYDQVGAAALETAKSQKMSAGDTLTYVQSKVAPMRKAFIDQAVAAGVPLAQARKLADTYLGLPKDIVTKLDLQGAQAAIDKLNDLHIKGAAPVQLKYTMIDNTADVRKRLDDVSIKYSVINGKIVINRDDLDAASVALGDLGVKTENLPDGFIKITDTSAENMAHLHDLGIKTQTLPDGTIVINPDDAAFWTAVNKAQEPGSKVIRITYVGPDGSTVQSVTGANGQQMLPIPLDPRKFKPQQADGSIQEYAGGGIRPSGVAPMPAQAVIEKGTGSGMVRWAEGETDWESYIPGALSKRRRSTAILSETARRFGYGLVPVEAMQGVLSILQRGDYDGTLSKFGMEEDSAAVDFLMKRRAGQKDSPLVSARKDFAALVRGGRALSRGDYDGILRERFNIEEDSPLISRFLGPRGRGPSMLRVFADGGITAGSYGMPPGGGSDFPQWVRSIESQFGVKASTYAGHQESNRNEAGYAPNPNGLNRGIDWTGTVDQMQAFAEHLMSVAPSQPGLEQIIWQNPNTGQKIGWHGRSPDTDGSYFAGDYGGHQDHVHTRQSSDWSGNAAGTTGGVPTVPLIQNPDGTWTSSDPAWAALIKRESGGDPDIVQTVQDANSGGNEASGLFQIAKGTWKSNGGEKFAPTAGEATPHEQAEIAAAIFNKSGGSPWGAGLPGRENEDALRAGLTTTTGTDTGTTTSGSGDGQRVFVTNWPGTGYSPSTPTTGDKTSPTTTDTKRRKLFTIGGGRIYNGSPEAFAEGGTVGGTGWTDSELIAAMPGEEIIRKRVAERPGVRAFLKRLNAGQIDGFATGGTVGGFGSGFGGYKPETIGSVPQTPAGMLEQLYRLGVAGWGGAAMLGSAIGTDGSFQGLSTGSSTIPILDDIAKKLDEVIKEGRVGSIGIYVGDGGQIVVEDMGKLRDTQDKAANDAMLRSAAMRA